jgi:hypothetical protein
MKSTVLLACAAILVFATAVAGYVEAPYTLGQVCKESTIIVFMEVSRVNQEKNLIIYKKLQDLKGQYPAAEIKHNIGQRGFHPREWQTIMTWAAEGKKAVFFSNGGASETCIGDYWYQCYQEGEWWGMTHAEPFLLRTYCGEVDKLSAAVTAILKGEEVVITCMADGNKELLHQRKGKLQRVKASLKRLDYNAKRDFVAFGGDGGSIEEYKTVTLLAAGSPGWKFLPAEDVLRTAGDSWRTPDFDDRAWRSGKAPLGYGEDELARRGGTLVAERGQPFVFRRTFDVPAELLTQKGVTVRIAVASDNSAVVFLNGVPLSPDPQEDHEFAYWNHEIELPPKQLKPGRNVLAVLVKNNSGSSDLYLDLEVSAQVPVPKPAKPTK